MTDELIELEKDSIITIEGIKYLIKYTAGGVRLNIPGVEICVFADFATEFDRSLYVLTHKYYNAELTCKCSDRYMLREWVVKLSDVEEPWDFNLMVSLPNDNDTDFKLGVVEIYVTTLEGV